jgi:multidrug resistance protein, MATE family
MSMSEPRAGFTSELSSIARLAAPLSSGLIVSTSSTLVDTAMLGHLGAVPLAAVSLTSSVIIIFYAALYGFAGPVGLFAGRAHGAGETAAMGRIGRHGLLLSLVGGVAGALMMASLLLIMPHIGQPEEVIAVIAPYWLCLSAMLVPFTLMLVAKGMLDSADRAWTAVLLSIVVLGCHILFNWLLIDGHLGFPALGLIGAGIASFLSQTVGAAVFWGYVLFARPLRSWWQSPGLTRPEFNEQWREAVPMTIQYFMEGGAVAIAGVLIGYFGAIALAGNQIALSVGVTVYMLPLGVAGAVTIRVAQAIGASESTRVSAIGVAGLAIVLVWMGMFALMFLIAGEAIARLFVDDPAIVAAAAGIFFIFGLTQLVDGVQSVSLGALRGMLDNAWPMNMSLVAYWLIALPMAWVMGFPLGLGAPGVWSGFGIGLLLAAIALLLRFRSQAKKISAV